MSKTNKGRKRNRSSAVASNNNNNNNNIDDASAATAQHALGIVAPITTEGSMPQKKFYRSRAHCNPLSFNENFDYPARPDLMDWTEDHYPEHPSLSSSGSRWRRKTEEGSEEEEGVIPSSSSSSSFHSSSQSQSSSSSLSMAVRPDVLDVGCGFGGLTLALSAAMPDRTILGLEIRPKVAEYVRLRILARRTEQRHPDDDDDGNGGASASYRNCSVMRTNAMKYLPNLFVKSSLLKMFFCFPDPHFKRKNHPRRIISERLLSEYAYLLRPNVGRLYCITDVRDLHDWHVDRCDAHPMFRKLNDDEMKDDPCVELMKSTTEEGKKVRREGKFGHEMYYAVYERRSANDDDDDGNENENENDGEDDDGSAVTAENFFEEGRFGVEVWSS
ncbi:hypothetical protein ACHAW5_001639 [Stephanodiscus triporus]|uniref:tRNA (guanine-N(7)-)-methyltransferase n=1 Tax=Stephanodiscus triporus TaxID=2934178 RepID=A0ABD3PZ97_9STRA